MIENVWGKAILLSLLGAVAYCLGGQVQTKIRDLGIPSIMLGFFVWTGHFHWSLILCFFLMFAAQTSYFKRRGESASALNWLFVGLAFSACMLPYAFFTHHWIGFALRSVIVTGFTVGWSSWMGNVYAEESGRGFIQIATLPFFL